VSTFTDSGCRVVSATDPYGHILSFILELLLLLFHYFQLQHDPEFNSASYSNLSGGWKS
jgi:hypothetical protein